MAITKPLNYKGCDPEVEKALRASMSITCYVSDYGRGSSNKVEIVAYVEVTEGPYIDSDGCSWKYATPAKEPVKWIMPPEKAIPILIREGWFFGEGGVLKKRVDEISDTFVSHHFFKFFGKELSKAPPVFLFDALSCIIEEK